MTFLDDLPGAWQEHGLFDEDGSREQNVPACANVIRTEREEDEKN